MKNYPIAFFACLLLFGCQSREDKVAKLIKDDMFKTLYDFESYEPIETTIDSAFTSIYTDTISLMYASLVQDIFDNFEEKESVFKETQNTMEIWYDSYSPLGRRKYKEAKEKMGQLSREIQEDIKRVNELYEKIQKRDAYMTPTFIGWVAKHKFRCKTKGGNFELGNYSYIFNEDISSILFSEDIDSEKNGELKGVISAALDYRPEKSDGDSDVQQTVVKDSLAVSLEEGI